MAILVILLILLTGILTTKYFLKTTGLLERIVFWVFFSLTVAPFLNINCVFLNGNFISNKLTLLTSSSLITLFGALIFLNRRANNNEKTISLNISKTELWVLMIAGLVAVFACYYYSNKEFILSLGSYILKGDAECFYMQTFRTSLELNPDFKNSIPLNKIYDILCTPGSILFTSTLFPVFKLYSFKIIYILFTFLLFVFVYFIINNLLMHKVIALMTAFFAVLNPYVLSVEVLDRNVMVLTISTILFYLLLEHKNKIFLHGLIFGILSGCGLRFLPLLFFIPIAILYYKRHSGIKVYPVFISAFVITFTFNIPHLYFHGLNSLGETRSSVQLLSEAITKWMRTPFLPFTNIIFYILNILNYFGYLFFGIILAGASFLWKTNRRLFFVFFLPVFLCFFILSYQRNWIEVDKYRIIIEAFLPLYVFFACGLRYILVKERFLKKFVKIAACLLLPAVFVWISSYLDFAPDQEFYKRKYIYQKESNSYHRLAKNFLLDISLLPNYKRLFAKLDLRRKAIEESLVHKRVFPKEDLPNFNKFKSFYLDWKGYFLKNRKECLKKIPVNYVYIKVDFENLAVGLARAVKRVDYSDICAIDFKEKDALFDGYYTDLNVSWQKEPLPVYVMLNNEEISCLNQLNIDLNAFISFGKDEAGFDIANSINFKANPLLTKSGFQSGVSTFPLIAERNSIVFCIPENLKLIIRNWFINEAGIPYKVDSWVIIPDKHGNYGAKYYYNEPESYL